MNIQITKQAVLWFKKELDLAEDKDYIRFFVRYGGCGDIQSGFSLGISEEAPSTIGAQTEIDGIIFFVEDSDLWYFKGYDLEVLYNNDKDEIEFNYNERN